MSEKKELLTDKATGLPLGQIIGLADLNEIHPTEAIAPYGISATELAFGDYSTGRWAWEFEAHITLVDPIECKGMLGLWKIPDGIADRIEAQFMERITHALSLTQPYASLVTAGEKVFETRSWKTARRGFIAIHASAAFPNESRQLCFKEPFASSLERIKRDLEAA